jgi:hypothetical protein
MGIFRSHLGIFMIDSKERLGECPKIVDSPNIVRTSLTKYLEIASLLISICGDGDHQNIQVLL